MKKINPIFILGLLFTLFITSGCSPIVKNEQGVASQKIALIPGQTVGQSFVASEAGLTGIDLLVEPIDGDSVLALSLYPDSQRQTIITRAKLPLKGTDNFTYQRFSFPALKDSARTYYYLDIQVESGSGARISVSPGENYLEGALYQDQAAQDLQMTFRLAYDRVEFGIGLIREVLGWGWFLILAGWLFVLPGWALLKLCLGDFWDKRRWSEKAALAAGVGLSIFPVLLLWLDLAHLRLGDLFIWIIPAAAVVYLAWKNRGWYAARLKPMPGFSPRDFVIDLAFLAVLGLIFFARFWVIRGVEVPLWGDSYQHTMIAQLIADNRGLFDSWQPYEPYKSLTVQYGFSANTAAWMWLTRMDSPLATVIFGQIQNFFAVLAIYPLAVKLARGNRWAGIASLVIAGLFSITPGFFVNWGRYAHLTGETILPVALCLLWYWMEDPRLAWRQWAIHGLALAGMLLSYYRMAFFYAAFIPVLLIQLWVHGPLGKNIQRWKTGILKLAALVLIGFVFISPWIPNVSESRLSNEVESGVVNLPPIQRILNDYVVWRDYQTYIPVGMIALLSISLLTSLVLKRWEVAGMIVWAALVNGVKAGMLIHLPGANMMQTYAVVFSMYLFVSLAAAWFIGWLIEWLLNHVHWSGVYFVLILVLGFSFYGLNQQRKVLDPLNFDIATHADVRAMEWIRSQTAQDAVFLVEGFRVFSGTSAVGSDGGWWIPLLAKRKNTMPPQYALVNERPEASDYSKRVVDLVTVLENHSVGDIEVRDDLCQWGITHVYIGQKQGLASAQKIQLFPAVLDESNGLFKLVYAQDRVRIYTLSPDACVN
jgi:hypothetical protein